METTRAQRWSLWMSLVAAIAVSSCGPLPVEGDEADIEAEPIDDGSNVLMQGVVDCSERQDTGYRNGSAFSITVVSVDGKPAERHTANAYYVMQQAANQAGVRIRIVSGFRTMAEQTYFWNCYQNCNCNSCNLAARPGYSNHQSGHALDLNTSESGVLAWLNAHGAAYGFARTVPSEAWHWEWWSGGPGGGPCGGTVTPPARGSVVGVAFDASQGATARLTGARIRLLHGTTDVGTTTSNSTGYWSISAPAGDYTVVATKAGFQEARRDATNTASGNNWASIGLHPVVTTQTGIYRGVVYAGPGNGDNPIAGAVVRLSSGQHVTTTETGAFSFDLPAGDITVTATKSGYTPATLMRTVTMGATVWGSIHLTQVMTPPPPDPLTAPDLLFPTDNAELNDGAVQLAWTRVEHSTFMDVTYEAEVYSGAVMGMPWVTLTAPQVNTMEVQRSVQDALSPGTYAWRVRALGGATLGPWSAVGSFVVMAKPVDPEGGSGSSSSGGMESSSSSSGGEVDETDPNAPQQPVDTQQPQAWSCQAVDGVAWAWMVGALVLFRRRGRG